MEFTDEEQKAIFGNEPKETFETLMETQIDTRVSNESQEDPFDHLEVYEDQQEIAKILAEDELDDYYSDEDDESNIPEESKEQLK